MRTAQKGFTLLEVLVALGVLAIALGAIIQSISQTTSNAGYLRDKTFAHWVAMNQVAELQAQKAFPNLGTDQGSQFLANHEWFWKQTVEEVPFPTELGELGMEIRAVTIEVRRERNDKQSLVSVTTALGKSPQ